MNHRSSRAYRRASILLIALLPLLTIAAQAQSRRGSRRARPTAFFKFCTPGDTIYWFDVAPFSLPVTAGPLEASIEVSGGCRLRPKDFVNQYLYDAIVDQPFPGTTIIQGKALIERSLTIDQLILVVVKPTLQAARFDPKAPMTMISSGIDEWGALEARRGEIYNPSSEWRTSGINPLDFQTVVTFKGKEVFNRSGVQFTLTPDEAEALRVTNDLRAEDIVTKVYWRPGGTWDQTKWVLLISNQPDSRAVILLEEERMKVIISANAPPIEPTPQGEPRQRKP